MTSPNTYPIRRYATIATALLAGSAALGCSANQDPTVETCLSAPAVKKVDGDPAADPNDRATWTNAVLVETALPADAKGLVVSWRSANSPKIWDDSSQEIDPTRAVKVALLVGDKDVVFGSQLVMEKGSPLCDWVSGETAAHSTFSDKQPIGRLQDSGAAMPAW